MDIVRRISKGRCWPFGLDQLPALLDVVEEQAIPLEIRLDQGTGSLSLGASEVRCRRLERCLLVQGQDRALRIDLDLLVDAHMVIRNEGSARRFSLALIGQGGETLLSLTGPRPGAGHAGDVWQLLMEALLPRPQTASWAF